MNHQRNECKIIKNVTCRTLETDTVRQMRHENIYIIIHIYIVFVRLNILYDSSSSNLLKRFRECWYIFKRARFPRDSLRIKKMYQLNPVKRRHINNFKIPVCPRLTKRSTTTRRLMFIKTYIL